MHLFRILTSVSCLLVTSANVFAADIAESASVTVFVPDVGESADSWSQRRCDYETVYNDVRKYSKGPVDLGRSPEGAVFLGELDGYRHYRLPGTNSYFFGVTSPDQRTRLMEKIDFLFRLIYSCGQQHSIQPIDIHSTAPIKKEFATTSEGFFDIFQTLWKIAGMLKDQGYVDERSLNELYHSIGVAISELKQSGVSGGLINQMYVPIQLWIVSNFPVSHMLKYVGNSLCAVSTKASGEYVVSMAYGFNVDMYLKNYYLKTPEYQKIQEWGGDSIGKLKTSTQRQGVRKESGASVNRKLIYLREFESFSKALMAPFDPSKLPVNTSDNDGFVAFVRSIELLHNQGEALLKKWIGIIDAEKEEFQRSIAAKRTAETASKNRGGSDEAFSALCAEYGIVDDAKPARSAPKKKKHRQDAAPVAPKAEPKKQREEAARADALRETDEARRLLEEKSLRAARLEATKRENAERQAAAEQRQAELRERREQEQQDRRVIKDGLLRREASWVDSLFTETQKLPVYEPSKLIDPAIFRGQADYKGVFDVLTAAGIYIKEHVHGNEKCVAMWKDSKGNM